MISGFENDIVILFVAFSIFATFGFSWWIYKNETRIPKNLKYVAITLRATALLILILLLFNPGIRSTETNFIRNHIAVLIDNSRSMTIEKGDWKGNESLQQVIDNLELTDTTNVRYSIFGFDRELFKSKIDSLSLTGSVTDINRAIQQFAQLPESYDAVILVTDGIFNRGFDPTTAALRTGLPFFTIATGDTTKMRDLLVRNVFYNPISFTQSRVPIRAEILNEGFPGRSIEVNLYIDNVLSETQTIATTTDRSVHTIEFETVFTTEGTKNLRIEIPPLDGEWTDANNKYNFTIDVRDDQIRILHLAFEVHPDVGALRHLLATDESIILQHRTWISQNRFSGGALPANADTLDLVILHGFPHPNIPPEVENQISQLVSRSNILILGLPTTQHNRIAESLSNLSPLRSTGPNNVAGVLPVINQIESDHTILDIDIPPFARAPELSGVIRNKTTASQARILLFNSFRGSDTGIPMIVISETGSQRMSQINAWNWFRWNQSTQPEIRQFYRAFFNNLVKWASASPDDAILSISTSRNSFDEGEPIVFRANVRTESGQPDSDARVEVTILNESGEDRIFAMRHIGQGRFTLDAGVLPAGTYSYEASSYRGTSNTSTQSGSFIVTESILELMDTVRRDELLQFIAEESRGAFFTFNEMDNYKNTLLNSGLLDRRSETFKSTQRIIHLLWWFLLVILLLTSEWILRKKYDAV